MPFTTTARKPGGDSTGRMSETNFMKLRWWWVLLVGATVAVLDYVLLYLTVYAYVASYNLVTGGEPSEADYQVFAVLGLPLIHLLLVILAARWVAYRTDGRFVLYGVLVGLVALVVYQLIGLSIGPFSPDEATLFLLATLVGGWAGGVWGRAAIERQEALFRASREIEVAQEPKAVVEAIGKHLAGPDVGGVAVWRTEPTPENETGHTFTLLASWTPRLDGRWTVGERLDGRGLPASDGPDDGTPVVLRGDSLNVFENGSAGSRGARALLLLPLRSAESGRFGLLMVAFRRQRHVFRRVARDYQTIGAQTALALENLRLVEEAQKAAVMDERQRLANEIHDTLAQGFNSIAINLDTAAHKLSPGSEPARRLLELSRSTARESLAEARRLVWALRPEALDRHSLRSDKVACGSVDRGDRRRGGRRGRRHAAPASAGGRGRPTPHGPGNPLERPQTCPRKPGNAHALVHARVGGARRPRRRGGVRFGTGRQRSSGPEHRRFRAQGNAGADRATRWHGTRRERAGRRNLARR